VIDLGMPQGASNSEGYALNDFNQVTGRSEFPIDDFPFFTNRAYFGDQNGLIDCGTLPGQSLSLPSDVSNDGIVVGTSRTLLQNDDRAFMWRDGEMHDLNELTELPAKWILVGAAAINKRQQIVAVVETAESEIATVLTSAVLAGIGDVDENCRVDIDDLLQVINHWGQIESPADINRDGIVNVHDLVIVLSNWTM